MNKKLFGSCKNCFNDMWVALSILLSYTIWGSLAQNIHIRIEQKQK